MTKDTMPQPRPLDYDPHQWVIEQQKHSRVAWTTLCLCSLCSFVLGVMSTIGVMSIW